MLELTIAAVTAFAALILCSEAMKYKTLFFREREEKEKSQEAHAALRSIKTAELFKRACNSIKLAAAQCQLMAAEKKIKELENKWENRPGSGPYQADDGMMMVKKEVTPEGTKVTYEQRDVVESRYKLPLADQRYHFDGLHWVEPRPHRSPTQGMFDTRLRVRHISPKSMTLPNLDELESFVRENPGQRIHVILPKREDMPDAQEKVLFRLEPLKVFYSYQTCEYTALDLSDGTTIAFYAGRNPGLGEPDAVLHKKP